MKLLQLIYASRPFGFDDTTLNSILLAARHNNPLNSITGALVCRDDLYLQLLEGPDPAVRKTYGQILRDDRHVEVVLISMVPVSQRLFPDWAMKHDPVQSWMWSREDVHRGAPKNTTAEEALTIFQRVATESNNQSSQTGETRP